MLYAGCFQACSLQIHNAYSVHRGVTAHPPLSTEDAVGLIIVNGMPLHLASHLIGIYHCLQGEIVEVDFLIV